MTKKFYFINGMIAAILMTLSTLVTASQLLRFQVYLDDRPIGEHSFRIADLGDITQVASRAEFDVDFLFINAYRYRHTSNEVFRDGCLTEIDARTDDNGKRSQVEGSSIGNNFRIERGDETEQMSGCIKTFAYWDQSFLANAGCSIHRPVISKRCGYNPRALIASKSETAVQSMPNAMP